TGILSFNENRWRYDVGKASQISLPDMKVDEVIRNRLDSLSEESQAVLRYASILGRHFLFDDLVHISAMPPERVLNCIDEAVKYHAIMPWETSAGDGGYTFAHDK